VPDTSRAATDIERTLRSRLAACYRVVDHLGWSEVIMNHITLRLPGSEHHFLINPYGLRYDEVTASNLVKIDTDGNKIGDSPHPVNPAGFVIHSAIHAARDDAHCVLHTHSTAGIAVATKARGLSHNTFYGAQFTDRVGYHDFEGLSLRDGEKPRLVKSLGDNKALILRNHGLLTVGRTVAEAFYHMWRLQRACESQIAADAMQGEDVPVDRAIGRQATADAEDFGGDGTVANKLFDALVRKVHRLDPSYLD
jgi:ribulose-5-phosphate 4-epimerase/fuculose-1-phosphate aldolase